MNTAAGLRADILAVNEDDDPVLLVEAKARQKAERNGGSRAREQLARYLAATDRPIPYAMWVDRRAIHVFRWDGSALSEPILEIPTANVLSFYDAEFTRKEIYETYFVRLIEAWLRDVAYHWKSESPPYFAELKEVGLATALHLGTTITEAALAA